MTATNGTCAFTGPNCGAHEVRCPAIVFRIPSIEYFPVGREQIDEQIKAEIALQVKGEVTNQIETHLPIPLAIQAAEVSKLVTITLLDSHDAIVL